MCVGIELGSVVSFGEERWRGVERRGRKWGGRSGTDLFVRREGKWTRLHLAFLKVRT